jgi:aminoglycoside phosphotransferase (APT) family kinase protein
VIDGPLTAEVIAGGKSNLTYRVDSPSGTVVLRRPPLAHVLPTAHDMAREYTVIAALHPTGFPVPRPLHLCTDPDPVGAPFYLMSYVDGVIIGAADRPGEDLLDDRTAAAVSNTLVDTLVELHRIDPIEIGLGDFGRPAGYLERQVRRWHQQWEASKTRELSTLDDVATALAGSVPDSGAVGIVHGDYRLDNCLFTRDHRRIAAVLDWEMATLGDPLADLGLLVVYTDLAADGLAPTPQRSTAGFLSGTELVRRYGDSMTGRAGLERIGWYVALGYYKLAIISEGIHARYLLGMTVGPGFERLGERVPELIDRAQSALATNA